MHQRKLSLQNAVFSVALSNHGGQSNGSSHRWRAFVEELAPAQPDHLSPAKRAPMCPIHAMAVCVM